jgi:hypothetical protein
MTKDRQRLLQIAIQKMPSAETAKACEAGSSIFASGDARLAMGSVKRLVAFPINSARIKMRGVATPGAAQTRRLI